MLQIIAPPFINRMYLLIFDLIKTKKKYNVFDFYVFHLEVSNTMSIMNKFWSLMTENAFLKLDKHSVLNILNGTSCKNYAEEFCRHLDHKYGCIIMLKRMILMLIVRGVRS